jgi:hypothetical protein
MGQDGRVRHRCLLVVTVLAFAGCGSKDSDTKTAASAATTSTTTSAKAADEPSGRLSRNEYASIRRAYRILEKLEGQSELGSGVRVVGRACAEVSRATALMDALRSECVATRRFLERARELRARPPGCTRAGQAGDVSCFAELFRNIGRSARVESVHAKRINSELRKRKIRGACADAIGSETKDIANTRQIVHDALGAAHALEARNEDSFRRASARLQVDLGEVDDGSSNAQAFRQLRACI